MDTNEHQFASLRVTLHGDGPPRAVPLAFKWAGPRALFRRREGAPGSMFLLFCLRDVKTRSR